MIFIPIIPQSIIDITTNSSSEIFVIGKDNEIELIEEMISASGWSWWFGEKKCFQNIEDVKEFIRKYSHVAEQLLGLKDFPSDGQYNLSRVSKRLKKLYKLKDSAQYDKKRAICSEIERQYQLELNLYLKRADLTSWVGTYYFECGEDNELGDDWDSVHDIIPGSYARLS